MRERGREMAGACRVAIIMIIIAVKHAPTLPRSLPLSISAICYFTHTSNFHHKYANIHIPAYTELLFRQCLPLSVSVLSFQFLCFSFGAFFFGLVGQNYYILITHALATLAAKQGKRKQQKQQQLTLEM